MRSQHITKAEMVFHDHRRKHVKLQDQTIRFLPSRCAGIEELHIEIFSVRDVQKDAAVFFQTNWRRC